MTPEQKIAAAGADIVHLPAVEGKRSNSEKLPTLDIIDPRKWQGQPLPERKWLVPGLIPLGHVTLLSGDGGLGKSLLAAQLATAAALGEQWLGRHVEQCRCFYLACEDDRDELQNRIASILKSMDRDFGDLQNLRLSSRIGQDNNLVSVNNIGRSNGKTTLLYNEITDIAVRFGAKLIILDSLHDLFAGNENARGEVRQFVGLLQKIAIATGGAVLLLAHPSVAGLSNGTGSSGSTAWNAAVRSRLYLTMPKGDEENPDIRELRTMKANYSSKERPIRLAWSDGVFEAEVLGVSGGIVDTIALENNVIAGARSLIENGAKLAAHAKAKNSLCYLVRQTAHAKQYGHGEIENAQARMLKSGRLKRVEMGSPSSRVIYIRPSDCRYPGEKDGDQK